MLSPSTDPLAFQTTRLSYPVSVSRQPSSCSKAKASGVYRGRKCSIDGEELRRLVAEGLTATQIAGRLNTLGRASTDC
jgi:hypothetical protein